MISLRVPCTAILCSLIVLLFARRLPLEPSHHPFTIVGGSQHPHFKMSLARWAHSQPWLQQGNQGISKKRNSATMDTTPGKLHGVSQKAGGGKC